MRLCPNRHPVDDTLDYCAECGSLVDSTARPASNPPAEALPRFWDCVNCGNTHNLGRFCEACGAPNPDDPDYDPAAVPPPPPETFAPPPVPTQWYLTADADSDFFTRMRAHDGPDADGLAFPTVYPPRRFTLNGEQFFIGRRSRSRGIDPDIDLSAAPADSGVSHAHAALIATADGWSLVDVGSSNGTYLNEGDEPIAVNTPIPLREGDQIHVGAWTRLTLTQQPRPESP